MKGNSVVKWVDYADAPIALTHTVEEVYVYHREVEGKTGSCPKCRNLDRQLQRDYWRGER